MLNVIPFLPAARTFAAERNWFENLKPRDSAADPLENSDVKLPGCPVCLLRHRLQQAEKLQR